MSKARLVITALFVEHQSPAEVAARYGVHRAWVYKLKARYEAEGEAALQPRSRRPKSSPTATPAETVELVLQLRKQLAEAHPLCPARVRAPQGDRRDRVGCLPRHRCRAWHSGLHVD